MSKNYVLTPAEMSFLLHCHVRGDRFERLDIPLFQEVVQKFRELEVIEPCDMPKEWTISEKGRFWIEDMLCTLPPKKVYISGGKL